MKCAFGLLRSPAYGAARRARNIGAAVILSAGAAVAEPVTIAALGDSLTQGYGLSLGQGLVPQLETWLRAQGAEVEIINAGVSGDTTAGGLSRVGWTLTDEVDAMIVTFGGNDLLRGIDPEVSRANLRGILEAAEAEGVETLLVGIEAPSNYGPAYREAFDGMYAELAEAFDVPLYPNVFAALQAQGETAAAARAYMLPDGIHPNPEGVQLIVEDLGPAVLDLVESVE